MRILFVGDIPKDCSNGGSAMSQANLQAIENEIALYKKCRMPKMAERKRVELERAKLELLYNLEIGS
jgi:hypothetical protein